MCCVLYCKEGNISYRQKPGAEMHQGVVSVFSIFFSKYAKKGNICKKLITGNKIKTKENQILCPQTSYKS